MSLYEISLFFVLSLIMLVKKGLDDAVSLSIYTALFIVGTAIGISTISNDNYHVSSVIGLIGALLACAKIFAMRHKFKMAYDRWIMVGILLFFLWNFFISSVMAYLLFENILCSQELRNGWICGWIAMLAGGAVICTSAIMTSDGDSFAKDKGKPFALTKGMVWIFSGSLLLAGLVHQIAIAYVFEIEYAFGDFISFIILFALLAIEIMRNYGKKAGFTEVLVSLLPFSAIVLAILNRAIITKWSSETPFLELFWTPTAFFLIGGLVFFFIFFKGKNKWFALTAVPYFIGMLVMSGIIPHRLQDFNWTLIGSIVVTLLVGAGLYYKNICLSVSGFVAGAVGIGMSGTISEIMRAYAIEVPGVNFLIAGFGLIVFAFYFKDRFPVSLTALGAMSIFLGSFLAFNNSFKGGYALTFSVIILFLASAYWMRFKNLGVAILIAISELRGCYLLMKGFTYWHYVALSFLLLGCGALLSIFRKPKNELPPEEPRPITGKFLSRKLSFLEIFVIVLIFLILLGMLVPPGHGSREKPRRICCASNLKQIGLALKMYSQDNKEFFPPYDGAKGLEMLRAGGYLENTKIYNCPSTIDSIPENSGITEGNCSYHYRGGLKESDNVDTAVAWDKDTNHTKYGNILFLDGHVSGYAGPNWKDNTKFELLSHGQ